MKWHYPDDLVTVQPFGADRPEEIRIRDLPEEMRLEFGVGHGRMRPAEQWRLDELAPGAWPYEPDMCPYAGASQGFWTRDGRTLFCPGCGFNGT
jgi:hypothetical protein